MTFGERLRQLREEKGLNQLELSSILKVSNSTLSLYESGNRKPDYEILINLAIFFDVSSDYLLGISNIRKPVKDNSQTYISLDISGLPEEAVKQISDYAEFIKDKYAPYSGKKKPK